MNKKRIPAIVITVFFLFISSLALMSAIWYITTYGNIGFASIVFTLTVDNGAVEEGILKGFFLTGLLPSIGITILVSLALFINSKKAWIVKSKKTDKEYKIFPFSKKIASIISVVLILSFLVTAAMLVSFPQYIISLLDTSTLYEDYYVDPNTVKIDFPATKRNVIYIMLESMETSFFSEELGGGLSYNVIPELYDLAENNTNFSHNEGIGGWGTVTNATWTIASIVSQTSGIPLSIPAKRNTYGKTAAFLPGATTITNVLKDNGYYQVFMCGSEGNYAGRDQYYLQHGADKVYDLFTARDDGLIPENYKVWWGMEDLYLYEYAKQELPKIAEKDQPFFFSMLTVDTHHVGGYKCRNCDDVYDEKYENVYSCASKQLVEFVNWIKEQPFYENTSIIIVGDHASMDNAYFERSMPHDYDRHMYNCIINAPVSTDNVKNRVFTPMDMFPTTLAVMGCTIEGDRLGLGTNLFSDKPTLAEEITIEKLNNLLGKRSDYYMNNFAK